MATGALDFFCLIWNHPVISCLVLLLFTPALFPIVVYFSPLLISTGLCAIALISMNMADSPETEDDPYLRRWQREQAEAEQSKPARESWSQWVTKVEEAARLWVDSRFTRRKQVPGDDTFPWKVIHDNDDENEVSVPSDPQILPPAKQPTKIKYGTQTEEEDCGTDHVQNKSLGGSPPSPSTKLEKGEIRNDSGVNHGVAGAVQSQKEDVISSAQAIGEVIDASTTKVPIISLSKSEEKPISSRLHALAEEIQKSNQKASSSSVDKSKPPTRPPPPIARDETERRGDGTWKMPATTGEGVALPVVQGHASHAPLSPEDAAVAVKSPPLVPFQQAATFRTAITEPVNSPKSLSSHDVKSDTASTTRSLPDNFLQPAVQLPRNYEVWPEKIGSSRSLHNNSVSVEAKVDGIPERQAISDLPCARTEMRTIVSQHLLSMNEEVAEDRMRKPEPTAYDVVKDGDTERDVQVLDAQLVVAEESAGLGAKNGEQSISQTGSGETELGRAFKAEVPDGIKMSVSKSPGKSSEGTSSPNVSTGSLDENEVGDSLAHFEKVIFVDESSKLWNSIVSGQQSISADGVKLASDDESVENKDSRREMDFDLHVLESERLLVSSDTECKCEDQLNDLGGLAKVDESSVTVRAVRGNLSEASLFLNVDLEKRGGVQDSEDRAGFCIVNDIIRPDDGENGKEQQFDNHRGETSEVLGSGSESMDAISSDALSVNILKGKAENFCSVNEGRISEAGGRVTEELRVGTGADQRQDTTVDGRCVSGLTATSDLNPNLESDVELEAAHESVPHNVLGKTDEVTSNTADAGDVRDFTASGNASDGEENYKHKKKSFMTKKSISMPPSSRQDERASKISTLGKASSFAGKKERDDDDSDSDESEVVVPIRRKLRSRNESLDSVEEITARLSKKYSRAWAKVPAKEGGETSRPTSAVPTTNAAMEPMVVPEIVRVTSQEELLNSPVTKGTDTEKIDESNESYMSPMKKVLSAVRSAGNKDKDGSGKNGQPPTSERKGLSSVLSMKRERFTSPLKRVLKSEAEGGKRASAGFTNKKKEKVGATLALTIMAEEERRASTDKFKDRLMMPLMKVFSTEARGGSGREKKPEIAQDSTLQESSPPILLKNSSGHKQSSSRDEVVADGKFRERFILPLKKKFSSDCKEERKKRDSAGSTSQTPHSNGPVMVNETSRGGNATSTSDRVKSPDKKFTLSWTKKRGNDDHQSAAAPQQAQNEIGPDSIFEKPRSPGISKETTSRVITHGKSNSTPSAVMNDGINSTDEFSSPERNFFCPLSKQQEKKEEESSQSSKERALGGKSSSSWWTRKRDRVVVEEATIAEGKQLVTDREWSSPERVIAHRNVMKEFMPIEGNSPSSSSVNRSEKIEQRHPSEKSDQQHPLSVRSRPNEERVSRAPTHRREYSDTLPTRFRNHERRMSLPDLDTPEREFTSEEGILPFNQRSSMSMERTSSFDKSNAVRKPQHARQRSSDMIDLRPEAHMYKSRSATRAGTADHAEDDDEELRRNDILPLDGSRSDSEVNKLYRNLNLPSVSSTVEIRITDKLKVPLKEVLSLLAVGDSSTRNSTVAIESSSSEETSSSEEEWSSSDDGDLDEDLAAEQTVAQKVFRPVQSWESHHSLYERNRQLRIDA